MPNLITATMLLLLALPACSLPRIVVLHDPLSADEHLRLASIYDTQGKQDLAGEHYHAAVRKDSRHAQAWWALGDFSFRIKDFAAAQEAFEKTIALLPENGDAYNNLAWVLLQPPGDARKAKDLALKALSLTPAHRPYYLDTLGMALFQLGNLPDAMAAVRESIATLPEDRPDLTAAAYDHLAEICAAAEDTPCASDAQDKARILRNRRQPAHPASA